MGSTQTPCSPFLHLAERFTPVSTTSSSSTVTRPGDRAFHGISLSAAILIVVLLAGVTIFLASEGVPGILASPEEVKSGKSFLPYVVPLVFGTLWAAVVALAIATPVAIGVALFISHYAPRRTAEPIGYVIDLLAAVPSVVYGTWGLLTLSPAIRPAYAWLAEHASWVPFFAGPASATGRTMLTACLVLAIMVLPIMTAICREIFLQTPRAHEEAALALGATRWEMARLAVFPYARSGIVSAAMLALGRALGETMAVAMVLSASGVISFNMISSTNPSTIAANIAQSFKEASGLTVNVLIASGLVLFIITLAVNILARLIVARRKEFSGVNS